MNGWGTDFTPAVTNPFALDCYAETIVGIVCYFDPIFGDVCFARGLPRRRDCCRLCNLFVDHGSTVSDPIKLR